VWRAEADEIVDLRRRIVIFAVQEAVEAGMAEQLQETDKIAANPAAPTPAEPVVKPKSTPVTTPPAAPGTPTPKK